MVDLKKEIKLDFDKEKAKDTLVNFLIPLICFGLSLLVGGLGLYPILKNRPVLQEELSQKQTLQQTLATKKAILADLVDFRSVVVDYVTSAERALVPEAMVPELLTQVNKIAVESGFVVTRLTYSYGGEESSAAGGSYSTVSVALGVTGTYDNFLTFLTSVENGSRIINVADFSYAANDGEDTGTISFNITLTSPYLYVVSSAMTDYPINLDMNDPKFLSIMERVKNLKYYDISSEELVVPVETSESEESAEFEEPVTEL